MLNGTVVHLSDVDHRIVVYVPLNRYFALQLEDSRGIAMGDDIAGAFESPGITGWLNVTQRLLLKGPVTGHGTSLELVMSAASTHG